MKKKNTTKQTKKNKALKAARAAYNATRDTYEAVNTAVAVARKAYYAAIAASNLAWEAHCVSSEAFQPKGAKLTQTLWY